MPTHVPRIARSGPYLATAVAGQCLRNRVHSTNAIGAAPKAYRDGRWQPVGLRQQRESAMHLHIACWQLMPRCCLCSAGPFPSSPAFHPPDAGSPPGGRCLLFLIVVSRHAARPTILRGGRGHSNDMMPTDDDLIRHKIRSMGSGHRRVSRLGAEFARSAPRRDSTSSWWPPTRTC